MSKKAKTIVVKKGRPVNPNSTRQQTLALKAELRAKGLITRGRPVNEESKRQAELARKAELREAGVLNGMKGRPVNPNSKRQQVLALRESGERRKPGRPKMVKQDAE
jgi:hypothetical protein